MIVIAKKENPKVEFKVGSGYKIPYEGKFDIVFASLALHYVRDWNKVFREVKRVLKKGGLFIFSNGNPILDASNSMGIEGKKRKVMGKKNYFEEKMLTAQEKVLKIERELLSKIQQKIMDHSENIHIFSNSLATLDVVYSLSILASLPGYNRPAREALCASSPCRM